MKFSFWITVATSFTLSVNAISIQVRDPQLNLAQSDLDLEADLNSDVDYGMDNINDLVEPELKKGTGNPKSTDWYEGMHLNHCLKGDGY